MYELNLLYVYDDLCYKNNGKDFMQIAVSIEPYLTVEKTKLRRYIEEIVQISRVLNSKVCLHFDYFKPNLDVFRLVQSYTDQIDIDLHLMQESAPSTAGFRSVSFDVVDYHQQITPLLNNIQSIKPENMGLVLDLGCQVAQYTDLIRLARYVVIMTVKCGKSGQVFQQSAVKLVSQVREINPQAKIIIDGGVNETNIDLLKAAEVDVVVVGSYAKRHYESGNLLNGVKNLLQNT